MYICLMDRTTSTANSIILVGIVTALIGTGVEVFLDFRFLLAAGLAIILFGVLYEMFKS